MSRAIDTLELALSNFMRYVPNALVRGIIGRKFSSELGGIRQPITVLFTDVFGFTTMAESLDPEEVMAKTSRYFSEIGTELIRSGATIDKYIGDSVMAFWNAPEQRDDHAALGMPRRTSRLTPPRRAQRGIPGRRRCARCARDSASTPARPSWAMSDLWIASIIRRSATR